MKRLSLFVLSLFVVMMFAGTAAFAQGDIMWQDDFEDDEVAPRTNVGWVYYGEDDIDGQIVEQREGELFIQSGSYGGLAGVGIV